MARRRKATHRAAYSTSGWRKSAPKTVESRRKIWARCGASAFLVPRSDRPGYSSFPIVAKGTTTCAPDCRGLRTAYARAKQYGKRSVAAKAMKVAKRVKCAWAVGE